MTQLPANGAPDWDAIARASKTSDVGARYRVWLEGQGARDGGYLFAGDAVRFEPRAEDVVVPHPRLELVARGKRRSHLQLGAAQLELGLSAGEARACLDLFDGRHLAEVRWATSAAVLAEVLRVGFGRVLFAPATLAAYEARSPSVEHQRFVSSPYGLERDYWSNASDVRAHLERLVVDDERAFVARLRELHVVLLTGLDGATFYRAASTRVAAVQPGQLDITPPERRRLAAGTLLIRGTRVAAALPGHAPYHRRLFDSLDDRAAGEPRTVEADGLEWGAVVRGRAPDDRAWGTWFIPPRPMTEGHWRAVRRAFSAAPHDVDAQADFHWCFVRLHPFVCGNQSLAMAVVNGLASPRGIPHLLLDMWALRLTRPSYRRLFRRAQNTWGKSVGGEPAARLAGLVELRQQLELVVAGRDGDARAALLED